MKNADFQQIRFPLESILSIEMSYDVPCTDMTLAPLRSKAMLIFWSLNRFVNQITVVYENMVICGCCAQFLSKLETFYFNRILNFLKSVL